MKLGEAEVEFDVAMQRTSSVIRIFHDAVIERYGMNTLAEMFRVEIEKQLNADPDLRLLVREMVAEAIRKMNLQEVVEAAVKSSLNASASPPR